VNLHKGRKPSRSPETVQIRGTVGSEAPDGDRLAVHNDLVDVIASSTHVENLGARRVVLQELPRGQGVVNVGVVILKRDPIRESMVGVHGRRSLRDIGAVCVRASLTRVSHDDHDSALDFDAYILHGLEVPDE
jgi:hypothetical protein